MKHEEQAWKSGDGLDMFGQSWTPDSAPRAVVALVHGLGDHSGRFPRLVEMLTAAGYAVSAFDQRGHGRSAGPRTYAPSYASLLDDIGLHLDRTRELFPGLPVFLYGQSFGGAQVLYYILDRYALDQRPSLSGVVASVPGLASGVRQSAFKVAMAKTLSALIPRFRIPLGSPAGGLSHDKEWLEETERDPLFQDGLTARLAAEMLKAGPWIRSHHAFPLPLLLMQGTEDFHVDAETNIAFGRQLAGDVTVKVWEGLSHELHNEIRKDEVIRFVLEWLRARR
jgi:alpha-beta hydrolase superfamily lysophospholipase